MGKIREKVETAAYFRHFYSYWLKNNEDGTILLFYKNSRGSPWINRYAEAESWLREKEQARLNIDNIERPNTKWVFMVAKPCTWLRNWIPWINRYVEAESWLREKEQARLNIDNIERPNTKWVFMVAKPCTWSDDGSTGHLPGQLVSLALHCSTPRCKTRSKHNSSTRACKEFL